MQHTHNVAAIKGRDTCLDDLIDWHLTSMWTITVHDEGDRSSGMRTV